MKHTMVQYVLYLCRKGTLKINYYFEMLIKDIQIFAKSMRLVGPGRTGYSYCSITFNSNMNLKSCGLPNLSEKQNTVLEPKTVTQHLLHLIHFQSV